MPFRIIVEGKTFEADTLDEFDALQERLGGGNTNISTTNSVAAGGVLWQVGRADAYFQALKSLAQGTIRKLAWAPDLKLTAGDIAKKLKRDTHAMGPAMKNIEGIAKKMKIAPPVRKIDLEGQRFLVLDQRFRDALKTAGTL